MNERERELVIELQSRDLLLLTICKKASGFISQTFILLNKVQAHACSTLLTTEAQSSSITNLNL